MTLQIDRRGLLLSGAFGLGALATPGGAVARSLLTARGFTHAVASGEPGPTSVLLWTRHVAANGDVSRLTAEVSETPDFAQVVSGGSVSALRENDHTARLTVEGLEPGRWYHYRFIAGDGSVSPTGRTRTLPVGPVERFKLGVFSCSNLPYGWFNAYAHAAERQDLDLLIHTGDYIYEYQRGYYPGVEQAVKDRLIEPAGELIHLADYRLRYASYRADPDLQRLHGLFPMIAQWDDHEIANDAWNGGAENHSSDEGDWAARKAAALKAWREWLPVSDATWAAYGIGDLADLFRPETRLTARSQRLDLGLVAAGAEDVAAAYADLRDRTLVDPARTLMGAEQEAWLNAGLAASTRRGARWQVLTQQVVMGDLMMPPVPEGMLEGLNLPIETAGYLKGASAAAEAGLPFNLDGWGGFPRRALAPAGRRPGRRCRPSRPVGRQPQRLGFRPSRGRAPGGGRVRRPQRLIAGAGGLFAPATGLGRSIPGRRQPRAEMGRHQPARLLDRRIDPRDGHRGMGVHERRGRTKPGDEAEPHDARHARATPLRGVGPR